MSNNVVYSKEQMLTAIGTKEVAVALIADAFQLRADIESCQIIPVPQEANVVLLQMRVETEEGFAPADAAIYICDNEEECAVCREYLPQASWAIQKYLTGVIDPRVVNALYGLTICMEPCKHMEASFYPMELFEYDKSTGNLIEVDDGMHEAQVNLQHRIPNAPEVVQDILNVSVGAEPRTEIGSLFRTVADAVKGRDSGTKTTM